MDRCAERAVTAMLAATATARRTPRRESVWRRLGSGIVFVGMAFVGISSAVALVGTGLLVAARPDILHELFVHVVVWWRWLG